jgi:DeoR family transcriptional regulator, fructose operon transcriptional repressor
MIPYERRNKILNLLSKKGIINLEEFCTALNTVSESTIRRDLRILEKEGMVENLRGGATKLLNSSFDTPIYSRKILHVDEKEKIAKTAAALVQNGDMIYLDVGTTVIRMVKYLKHKKISIVTTDASIIQELGDTDLTCILVGGEIIPNTASLVGPMTDTLLKELFFDKAFLGTYGFDLKAGFSSPDIRESTKKKIVKENSNQVYILADSSKEGKRSLAKSFDLGECTLITDKLSDLVKNNTNYILAE